jgi:hypothetical protein
VTIAQSAGEPSRVTDKVPNEVSLVVKGARDHTRIHAWGRNTRSSDPTTSTQYILSSKSTDALSMEQEAAPTPQAEAEPTEAAPTEPPSNVLNELRQQAEVNARMQAQLAELQSQLSEYKKVGQKRRQDALDGGVKDWFQSILKKFPQELGEHSDKFQEIFKAMTENEEAEPMVKLLSCAASQHKQSTVELEKKYQAERAQWESERKRMKTQLEATKPAFSEAKERFQPPSAAPPPPSAPSAPSDAYQRMFTTPTTTVRGRGGGMAQTNPTLYNMIRTKASSMPDGGSKAAFDTSLYSDKCRTKLGW